MKRLLPFVMDGVCTKSFTRLIFTLTILSSLVAVAQPTVLGSQVVNGTYSTTNLNTVGGFKQVRLQATSSAASSARNWEFASGTAAATNYNPNWRPYTSGNTLSVNSFIPVGFANGARYNTGGGASGLLPAITSGNYYTFNVSNNATSDNVMSLLETSYNPVTIPSSTRFNNTVNIVTSGTPNAAENIFVRYSTNAYATSSIVQATGSGTSWAATIPLTSGAVSYYIYTSNRSKAAIDGDVTTYGQGVHDMSTLNLLNNSGSNYSFTATATIAYNEITGTNPNTANPYTTGQVVTSNATATGIGRGTGITGTNANDRYNATAFSQSGIDLTDYFEFTITPNTGFRLNFSNFIYTGQASGTGPTTAALRSSLDGYVATIGTATITGSTISLTAATYQAITTAVTFRLYAWGGTGGTFSINDYTFNGTVDAIPAAPILAISGSTSHGTSCVGVAAAPIQYTITNSGSVAASGVTVVSSDPQFVVSGLSSTTIASGGGTATYNVTFTPSASGAQTSTVTVASTTSGSNSPTSSLTGTGATPVTAAVSTSAATAVVNSTATLNGNVTALGVCPATIEKGFVYSLTTTNATPTVGGSGVTKTPVAGLATGTYTLGLTGLTPNSGYSFAAYVYNGSTYTYGSVLTFTTLAVADHLAFVGVPSNGNTNTNLASFTVEARRPNNTVDTEYTANVTISKATGPGTLSGTVTVAAVAGVATFSAAQFDTVGTVTLAAASGALTGATSGNIVITPPPVVLAGWDFTGQSSPATFAATTFNANLVSASGGSNITRGAGAASSAASNSFRTVGFQNNGISTANTDYFQTTLTTNAGVTMNLTAINAIYAGTASYYASPGVTSQYAYSLDGTTFTLIGSPVTSTAVSPTVLTVDLSSVSALQNVAPNTTVTFRYYASGQTSTGGWGYTSPASGTNGLAFTGNVTCISPTAYAVTGGGTICAGSGTAIGLANSQSGINYQLQRNAANTGSPVAGTGAAITFGSQTLAGTYTVVASNTNGTCALNSTMTGSATITVNPTSVAGSISGAGTVCTGTNSTTLTLSGNTGGIQWQVSTNGGVTYSNLTGQTASTYTATNLTATTYYQAVVTSGVCASATTTPVTITVNPTSVAGTISGAGTVCSGTNSTTLTLSGNTGTIQWQSSADGVTYSNLTGQTASTYTATNLTATTYYQAVVTSGVCASATTTPVTITVNPTSVAGTISGAGTVCSGTNSTTLTLAGNTGTIQWQSSADGVTYSNLAGQTASTYTATNLTATTYYQAVVTSGVCASATTTPVTITVNPVSVAGTISGAGTVCSGTNSTTLTLSGNTGTIQWQSSADGVTYSNLGGQTASTYTATNLTATTYYQAVVTSGVCASAATAPATITVNPTSVAGTISGAGTVCSGTNSTTLTLSGNTGMIQWQSSADGVTYSNLTGQTASTYTATNLTATTYYQAVVTSGVCASATTTPVTITVNPTSVAGTISGAGTVCSGTNSTTLTLSGNTGTIQWQSSADGVTYSNLTGQTASTYTATNLTTTTYYQAVVTSGVCASATTTPVTITVNPTSVAGTISGAGTVCSGTNSTTLTLSGNTGSIQWQVSTDGGATYSDISAATASTYTATNLTATTYYQAVVTSGVCASATTTPVTITVNPTSVAGTISGAGTVCSGTNSTTLTLAGNTGTIQWQSSADGVTYSNLTGQTASTYTATNLTATTYYQAVVTSGVCSPATSAPVSITVNPTSVAGTVSADQAICGSTQPSDITLTGSTGSIQWQSSPDNVTFTDISGETASTLSGASIGALTSTMYYRAVVTSGSCASATSAVVTVTVGGSTTWDGTAWSNGTPNGTMGIIFTGSYTSTGDLSGCSLYITNNATVTITAGDDITLNSSVTVDSGSNLVLNNTANLIQVSNAVNTGSITVNCDSNPLMRLDYTMWSSPVTGAQTLQSFSLGTLANRFYTYNPATDLYNAVADPSATTFATGTGYLIRVPNTHPLTPTVWSGAFTGTPNNGDVNLSVTSGTYNGVGNPYPSAIDADAFITGNSLSEALYFWRKTNNSVNTSYATYTLAGGAGTSPNTGDPNSLTPNGTIRAGQGFIAKSTSTSLTFTNAMRTGDNGGQFFRASSADRHRIWVDLTSTDGVYSQTMVAYMTGATMDVDAGIDGKYFDDSENALTSLIGGLEYAVQGRALPFDGTDIVPLGFKVVAAGTYAINLDHVDGLFADLSQGIYLKDNLLNVTHDLRSGTYVFTAEAGAANDRFEIVYTPELSTTEMAWDASQVVVYKDKADIVINTGKVIMGNVKIYDIRGRLIVSKDRINASEVRMSAGSTQEVLIVKITSDDNKVVNKKVVN